MIVVNVCGINQSPSYTWLQVIGADCLGSMLTRKGSFFQLDWVHQTVEAWTANMCLQPRHACKWSRSPKVLLVILRSKVVTVSVH